MAINLRKGQQVDLSLRHLAVGLGWDPSARAGVEFDLDASAFMVNAHRKVPADSFFVFYNNLRSSDGSVSSSGDDRTGGNSAEGDDETLTIDLARVDERVQEIVIVATIYEAEERRQNFGQVHNAYIRIVDLDRNVELARYDLEEDFSVETGVEFGRLIRHQRSWKFEALGGGVRGGLEYFTSKYAG